MTKANNKWLSTKTQNTMFHNCQAIKHHQQLAQNKDTRRECDRGACENDNRIPFSMKR